VSSNRETDDYWSFWPVKWFI